MKSVFNHLSIYHPTLTPNDLTFTIKQLIHTCDSHLNPFLSNLPQEDTIERIAFWEATAKSINEKLRLQIIDHCLRNQHLGHRVSFHFKINFSLKNNNLQSSPYDLKGEITIFPTAIELYIDATQVLSIVNTMVRTLRLSNPSMELNKSAIPEYVIGLKPYDYSATKRIRSHTRPQCFTRKKNPDGTEAIELAMLPAKKNPASSISMNGFNVAIDSINSRNQASFQWIKRLIKELEKKISDPIVNSMQSQRITQADIIYYTEFELRDKNHSLLKELTFSHVCKFANTKTAIPLNLLERELKVVLRSLQNSDIRNHPEMTTTLKCISWVSLAEFHRFAADEGYRYLQMLAHQTTSHSPASVSTSPTMPGIADEKSVADISDENYETDSDSESVINRRKKRIREETIDDFSEDKPQPSPKRMLR